MSRLPALTPSTASGAARDLLADLVDRHGQVGEMVRTMAHSPAVLGGYLQLSRAMKRAKLGRATSERISIAIQVRQGCELCLHSHESAARSLGVTESEIERARDATSADPKIAAMVAFGFRVFAEPPPSPTPRSTHCAASATETARSPTCPEWWLSTSSPAASTSPPGYGHPPRAESGSGPREYTGASPQRCRS